MDANLLQDVAYAFGPYKFLPKRQTLLHGQRQVKLGARSLEILHLLVMNAGEPVTKSALVSHVWPSTFVDDCNLRVHIRSLRRALGETRHQPTYIATVAGLGYRFVGPVSVERNERSGLSWATEPIADTLPPRRTIIGREAEIGRIGRILDPGRLVTLVGAGGVGKTAVAVAIAHERKHQFADGVCFVDLSATDDHSLVPHLLATALGVRASPSEIESAITAYLTRTQRLLILDNCEHVLRSVAVLADKILGTGIGSTLLATSRAPLTARGENVVRIEPLKFPDQAEVVDVARALSYSSVELFAARALELVGYRIKDNEAVAVARLCEALDGLPLAIEIAAAKLDQFTPAQILSLSRQKITSSMVQEAPARRLMETIDWSYSLLSPEEARIFRLLSVFAGMFELTDAVQIAQMMGYDPHQATAILGSLVSKSLLATEVAGGVVYFKLLEITRSYASLKLLQDEALDHEAHRQHANLTLLLFERADKEWNWTEIGPWRSRYGRRSGDLRKALDWCFESHGDPALGVRLAAAAIRLWNEQSSIFEQMFQVGRALDRCPTVASSVNDKAKLAVSRAWSMTLARQLGAETEAAWQQAIDLSESCADPIFRFAALSASAIFLIYTGQNALAASRLQNCIAMATEEGDQSSVIDGERRKAFAEMHVGLLIPARDRLNALARGLKRGMPPSRIARYKGERYVSIHTTLTLLNWLTGNPDIARATAEEMVERTEHSGDLMGQSNVLSLVVLPIALWSDDILSVARGVANLQRNLASQNIAIWEPVCRFYEAACQHARGEGGAIRRMETAIENMLRDGLLIRTPMYLGILAEAMLARYDLDRAEEIIKRALVQQGLCSESWCLPELLRIEARVATERRNYKQARQTLREGMRIAQKMEAIFFQGRIANDLASLPMLVDE